MEHLDRETLHDHLNYYLANLRYAQSTESDYIHDQVRIENNIETIHKKLDQILMELHKRENELH